MSLKIMHTGDIHLGMKFTQYPQISKELEEARYLSLERWLKLQIIKTAIFWQ